MTETMEQQDVLKYYERINIPCLSINGVKKLIKNDIVGTVRSWEKGDDVKKQCFHIIGPAGVGKTEICGQIAQELSKELGKPFDMIMVKAPVLSRDDFIIPFPVIDNGNTSFKMLYSDFVPKGDDTYGLFVIDEFSRGDHSLQQLLWQVQNEYSVHRYDFPKGWFVISVDNPDDQEYSMDILEDAAGLRRQLHVYTEVNAVDFLTYARKAKFHKHVIEYIQSHPDRLYDFDAQKTGQVFANPASYEKLSTLLIKMENVNGGGLDGKVEDIETLAAGLLNVNMARMFVEFVVENKDISPQDILDDYAKVRAKIEAFKMSSDNATLTALMDAFTTYMIADMPVLSDPQRVNIATFLSDLPLDTAATFIMLVDQQDKDSKEFLYFTELHVKLMSNPDYKSKFFEAVVECGKGKQ